MFLGWGRRKLQRENEKLRLEIEKLKKENSKIYLPTPDEIKAVLSKTDDLLSKLNERNESDHGNYFRLFPPILTFGFFFREYLRWMLENYPEIMKGDIEIYDPESLYEMWVNVRSRKYTGLYTDKLEDNTVREIDLLLSLLLKAKQISNQARRA